MPDSWPKVILRGRVTDRTIAANESRETHHIRQERRELDKHNTRSEHDPVNQSHPTSRGPPVEGLRSSHQPDHLHELQTSSCGIHPRGLIDHILVFDPSRPELSNSGKDGDPYPRIKERRCEPRSGGFRLPNGAHEVVPWISAHPVANAMGLYRPRKA